MHRRRKYVVCLISFISSDSSLNCLMNSVQFKLYFGNIHTHSIRGIIFATGLNDLTNSLIIMFCCSQILSTHLNSDEDSTKSLTQSKHPLAAA